MSNIHDLLWFFFISPTPKIPTIKKNNILAFFFSIPVSDLLNFSKKKCFIFCLLGNVGGSH